MPALCQQNGSTDYAQNYAGIIASGLVLTKLASVPYLPANVYKNSILSFIKDLSSVRVPLLRFQDSHYNFAL